MSATKHRWYWVVGAVFLGGLGGAPVRSARATTQRLETKQYRSGPCDRLINRFHARWAQATGRCSQDSDCACYPTDVQTFCAQDATDQATHRALEAIRRTFLALGCRDSASLCSPYLCNARCVQNHCVNQSYPSRH